MSPYAVWRRPGTPIWRIFLAREFAPLGPYAPPAADDPDYIYSGAEYAVALAAATQANAATAAGRIERLGIIRQTHAPAPAPAAKPPRRKTPAPFQPVLFP